jgi:3-hydroxyacyl-CoA dehydrogenase / enoyl-CoA hydratase / 3-hydroxybutyryl-CoA epimerase
MNGKAISWMRRADGVAVVTIDVPGESVNTLKANFAEEFGEVFDEIERDRDVKAVVIASGKPDSFIVGADIKMLRAAGTREAATGLSRMGHKAMDRVERCKVPVVAAIAGACLGGGLELALACRARIAGAEKHVRLGLPEVQLGILPGMGGTQRLPRLIGVRDALDLLLTGKQVDARRAKRMGLVDEVVPSAIVLDVAAQHALGLANTPAHEHKKPLDALRGFLHSGELTELALAENPLGRKVVFDQAKKKLLAKTHGHYPAPEKILDVVRLGLERGLRRGLEAESDAFGELAVTPVAQQLMEIFFAQQALKKDRGVDVDATARSVERVGILGAGLMGAGIAYVSVLEAGAFVRLKDRDPDGVARGLIHVKELLDERVERRRMTRQEREFALGRITRTTDYEGFRGCQVVIEAVFEDLALKHEVLSAVEAKGAPEGIFASNTSSLPITRIAEKARFPERVIGMHYFSPVPKMPLCEIIVTERTAPWVTTTCVELAKRQGKTVIVVRDGAGFYTSRILGPYLAEAAQALAEGYPVDVIDDALVELGFPVGPLALLDEVGIDVGAKVATVLHEAFGSRMAPPPGIERLLGDQRLGRKNQRGFYEYSEHHKGRKPVDESIYGVLGVSPRSAELSAEEKADLAERCLLQMVNEAAHCFGEGILRSARDGDIGAIFGLGFPPYLGGPFRYVDARGAGVVVAKLEQLENKYGERFRPAPALVERAKKRSKFHE